MDPGGPYLLSRFGPGSPYLLVDMDRGSKSTGVQINWDTCATVCNFVCVTIWYICVRIIGYVYIQRVNTSLNIARNRLESVCTHEKIILSVISYFSDPRLFTLDPRLATLDQKVDSRIEGRKSRVVKYAKNCVYLRNIIKNEEVQLFCMRWSVALQSWLQTSFTGPFTLGCHCFHIWHYIVSACEISEAKEW